MNSIVVLSVIAGLPFGLPYWVPDSLKNSSTFELEPVGPGRRIETAKSFNFVEKASGATIIIGVGSSSPNRASNPMTQFSVGPTRELPASGIPLGHQTRVVLVPGHIHYVIVNRHESSRMSLNAVVERTGSIRRNRPDNYSDREAWVEAMVREAMGRYASRRAGVLRSRTISDRSVPVFTSAEANTELIDLNAWAQARNVELNHNEEAHRVSFSWRGQTHIVALATDKIKVGSTWKTMPDIVMEHQGKMWVPFEALE